MKSIVSEKGQITIPKKVREKLGLRPGTVLDIEAVEGRLVGMKKEPADPFSKWLGKGKIPGNMDVDTYLERARG
jgi:AbrB family looped-hinge helix DNA binding protein